MRTAEAILISNIGMIPFVAMNDGQRKSICEAINEAKKETLEYIAEQSFLLDHKNKILSLINQFK